MSLEIVGCCSFTLARWFVKVVKRNFQPNQNRLWCRAVTKVGDEILGKKEAKTPEMKTIETEKSNTGGGGSGAAAANSNSSTTKAKDDGSVAGEDVERQRIQQRGDVMDIDDEEVSH